MSEKGLAFEVKNIDTPKSREGVLQVLTHILSKPYIQKVVIDKHVMEVSWYKAMADELMSEDPDTTPEEVLENIELTESDSTGEANAVLNETCFFLELNDLQPTFLFCADVDELKKWLGIHKLVMLPKDAMTEAPIYCGLRIIETDYLSDSGGVVVVCGSNVKSNRLSDIIRGIKLIMESNNG